VPHGGVDEDSGVLGCDDVVLGESFLTFRMIMMPSPSKIEQSKKNSQYRRSMAMYTVVTIIRYLERQGCENP
jgi:hypothetical protein